ncbi:MAG: HupE/UreJ family protein [Blastocatellia bacterium]|nr:HupE/UreJ family protein [Blastocatellia bacterium]
MKSRTKHLPTICLLLVYLVIGTAAAFAHDPGLSAIDLRVEGEALRARLSFSRAELEPLAVGGALDALGREAIEIRIDGRPVAVERVATTIDAESGAIHFELAFAPGTGRRLELRSRLIERLALGHRQFLTLRGAGAEPRGARLLDARANAYELDLAAFRQSEERPATFWGFLKLGIEHILLGFDHLAFLLALLLAGSRLREAARIITSFTIAHSITLGLATFDLVRLSPAIVEPLIAVSIVYVGIENLLGRGTSHRWLLTFGFGLIHGFGFATVLRELGIAEAGASAITPLLAFNLGVEFGQLAIAALLLPLLWKLKQRPSFVPKYAPACSLLIMLAGVYWLLERTIFD